MTMTLAITRAEIERVHQRIAPYIRRTPIVRVAGADLGVAARELTLKLELLQRSGSFKTRGAFTNLLTRASIDSPDVVKPTLSLTPGTTVEEAETRLILMTLEHTRDNKTRAAEILGISLKTLHNKLNKLRLRPKKTE